MKRNRLIYALARLSDRERLLLALLGGVVLPLAVVFLLVLPMQQARDTAHSEAAEAEAILAWVSKQVAALPADGAQDAAPAITPNAPIGISAIEQSLVQAGLRAQVQDLSNRTGGGIDLAFDAVEFAALTGWLADISPTWGYRIAEMRIEQGDAPGLVRAAFQLEPAQ